MKHYSLQLSCNGNLTNTSWNLLSADPELFSVVLTVNTTQNTRLIYWAP